MSEGTTEILHNHGLRKTLGRELVLQTILANPSALSHGELNQLLGDRINRASLYRVLQSFEEHGLVHKVPDDEVSVKFAYCGQKCSSRAHSDRHPHFKCENCGETRCLNDVETPILRIPPELQVKKTNVLLSGLCEACQ